MEPEKNVQEKSDMTELLELTRENNRILKSLRRIHRWNVFFRVVYWIIIVGIAVGAFYFLQPYVDQFKSISGSFSNLTSSFFPSNNE
jgi:predicted negative regulator of RcsB-dependent stress response